MRVDKRMSNRQIRQKKRAFCIFRLKVSREGKAPKESWYDRRSI